MAASHSALRRQLAPAWIRFIKFHIKLALFAMSVFIATATTAIIGIFRPCNTANNNIAASIFNFLGRLIFRVRVEVRGRENLTKAHPCIYVCNHQSSLDVLCLAAMWPEHTAVLGKKELLYMPIFGQFFYLSGNISIDRVRKENAMAAMETAVRIIKEKKRNVWIFPEGTRNREEGMLPFKKGAFHLAVQAQVPIVPVVFSQYHDFYCKKDWLFDSGRVVITALPPVPTTGLASADVDALIERTRNAMLVAYNDTAAGTITAREASHPRRSADKAKSRGKGKKHR